MKTLSAPATPKDENVPSETNAEAASNARRHTMICIGGVRAGDRLAGKARRASRWQSYARVV